MLDVQDFITERGGNPELIRESQRRRHAPVEVVDEVIAMWEDHRKSQYYILDVDVVTLAECKLTATCLSSTIRCHPDEQQDQRHPEADRRKEKGHNHHNPNITSARTEACTDI